MENQEDEFEFLYKVVVIGDTGVGKSNIISRFLTNEFVAENKATIGVEFGHGEMQVEDGTVVKVQLWDTAGQERFRSITRGYYRGAIGALIVFDVTQSTSFQNIMKWLEELHDYSEKQTIVVLIGNKTDLKNQRQISTEDAKEFAAKNDLLYMETSAREGQNIHAAFKLLVNEIYKKHKKHQREDLTSNVVIKPNGNPITLPNSPKSDQENNEKCKC